MKIVTFKLSLDSIIIISHLSGDVREDDVLGAIKRLKLLEGYSTARENDAHHRPQALHGDTAKLSLLPGYLKNL
jgi:hypothetical protein